MTENEKIVSELAAAVKAVLAKHGIDGVKDIEASLTQRIDRHATYNWLIVFNYEGSVHGR